MSEFESEVARLEASMLQAIAQPGDSARVSELFLKACYPNSAPSQADERFKALSQEDKVTFRHSMRTLLDTIVQSSAKAAAHLMEYVHPPGSEPSIPRLLDTVLWLCDNQIVDTGMVFTLLEDVVEASTVDECPAVFSFIEARVPVLHKPHLFERQQAGKLVMLRCCNQLLRRLSKGNNPLLCGRISLLLARLLPIWDKSSVNQVGSVNSSNPLIIEDVEEGATDSNGAPIDVDFYRTFWGIQRHFQAPLAALESENWDRFCADLDKILAVFRSQRLTSGESNSRWSEGLVKYLTSSKLIHLQLQDPSFRRQFLVQCLILFHFAREPIVGKERKPGLKDAQLTKANNLEKKVLQELRETPDCGDKFAKAVTKLLERESAWVAWKAGGAQPFSKPPVDLNAPAEAPPRKKARGPGYKVQLGTEELDSLWNLTENNTSSLKAEDRGGIPTCQEFLRAVAEQMDPEEGIEEEYKEKNDKSSTNGRRSGW
uniref:THO complex subunit 1 n=1 Tax=Tetraselmis sp. GSL018 TaxID=582737 RepID=A0A061R876_9CHLO